MEITTALPSALRYLPRRLHVFSTATVVYIILKTTQLINRWLKRDDESSDTAWSEANTRAAKKVLRTAVSRRGLWIKCCQYIAARADALPPEYAEVLSKCLDDCPPTPAKHVRATVQEELKATPAGKRFFDTHGRHITIEDVYEGFDDTSPIASASIAQVHIATLKESGRKVVLKIQHPGIRPMLLQDLEDLKTLLRWIAGAEPKYDMRPVLDAWIDMVPLETNFLNEMKNLKRVKASLVEGPEYLRANAYVPEPLEDYTSDRVFVMEYIDGCKVTDVDVMEKHQVRRKELVTEINRSFGNQLFVGNVFSGDPHPGNFLVHRLDDGGAPVLLDFGICVEVSANLRRGFAKLILAAVDNDSYSLIQAMGDVGVKLNRADPVASLDVIKYLFRTTSNRDQSRKEQDEMKKNLEGRKDEIEKNEKDTPISDVFSREEQAMDDKKPKKRESRAPIDSFPGDLVFFFRSLGMLRGLAVSLDVQISYLEILRPFAEYALRAECPKSEALKEVVYRPIFTKGPRPAVAARALVKVFDKLYEKNMMIGMQVAAYRNGELVLNMAGGRMGKYDDRPVKPDSVFNSFSSTKGLSAIMLASLQDEHGVEYNDPVTKYWPEYAQGGKGETTIADILSHSAGLANALPEDMAMMRLRDDWQGLIKHLESAKPSCAPGEKSEYHVLTFGWLVAGLIAHITGKSYQDQLVSFAQKLDIADECFCGTMPKELLPDEPGGRVAALSSSIFQDLQDGPIGKAIKQANAKNRENDISHTRDGEHPQDAAAEATENMGDIHGQTDRVLKDLNFPASGLLQAPAYILDLNFFNHPVLRAGFLPSANGHFSARALAKLYAAVANDGIVERKRILAPGRAEKMQTKFCDVALRGNRAWGAGLTLYDCVDSKGNEIRYGGIGHGGIGGSFAFAVPSKKFSMAVTVNKLNALSLSAAIVVAVVCRTMDIPMPSWYHMFASKAMKSFKEDDVGDLSDEAGLIDKILNSEETDVMKMLVG